MAQVHMDENIKWFSQSWKLLATDDQRFSQSWTLLATDDQLVPDHVLLHKRILINNYIFFDYTLSTNNLAQMEESIHGQGKSKLSTHVASSLFYLPNDDLPDSGNKDLDHYVLVLYKHQLHTQESI